MNDEERYENEGGALPPDTAESVQADATATPDPPYEAPELNDDGPTVSATLLGGGVLVTIFIPNDFVAVDHSAITEAAEQLAREGWTQPPEVEPGQEGDAPPVA